MVNREEGAEVGVAVVVRGRCTAAHLVSRGRAGTIGCSMARRTTPVAIPNVGVHVWASSGDVGLVAVAYGVAAAKVLWALRESVMSHPPRVLTAHETRDRLGLVLKPAWTERANMSSDRAHVAIRVSVVALTHIVRTF